MSQASFTNKPKPHKYRNIVGAVVILILIVIISVGLLAAFWPNGHVASTPIIVNRILLDGTITVNAGTFWYLQFLIPSGAFQIQVSGNFTALGGGNDIGVYVINATSFNINAVPESSMPFSAYYDSG
jgi:hypothetical protein